MNTPAVGLGICKNAGCLGQAPVERYDGPGMFCPSCGELLQAFTSERSSWALANKQTTTESHSAVAAAPLPRAKHEDSAAVGFEHVFEQPVQPTATASAKRSVPRRLLVIISAVGVFVLGAVVTVSGALDHAHPAVVPTAGVCASSTTGQLARDIVTSYAARLGTAHFESRASDCDITFAVEGSDGVGAQLAALRNAPIIGSGTIARDAIVAIVNPQNVLTTISMDQLRSVLSGTTTNWTGLHGANERISVYLPSAESDESRIAANLILKGAPLGSAVIRVATSADVVRAVAAANGRNAIGIVPFSGAEPGKVLGIQHFPPPSILSIGEGRYPLTIVVTARARKTNDTAVANLLKYTTSDEAKAVVAHDGFIP